MYSYTLGWLDYVIFVITLGFSVAIGVYFGFFKKQNSAREYLYGNGQMRAIPIGLSLYSSAATSIVILGIPSEIYVFGSQYLMTSIGSLLSLFITCGLILPVFCGNLNIKSPYEYIELRFNYAVRVISSIIYFVHTLLFIPLVLYASTLAVSEATGISLELCVCIIGGICVFYTTAGGFLSVIWTDSLQAALMLCFCVFTLYRGAREGGGMGEVWRRAKQGNRIILFNINPDPFQRLSFWSVSLGMGVWFAGHSGCSASSLQRYMALPSEKHARISCAVNSVTVSVTVIVSSLIGLCMYSVFYDCDPVQTKKINGYNQMVPYYVAQIMQNIPGLYGFFTAALLSAGLSTISAEMNTIGGILYYDIIQKLLKSPLSPAKEARIIKVLVLFNGLFYLIMAPQFQKSKYVLQVANTISGVTYGLKVGVMVLGIAFPKCNSKGVICGMIAGIAVVSWIGISGFYYDISSSYMLPMSTNCSSFINDTNIYLNSTDIIGNVTLTTALTKAVEPWFIFKLSFLYFPLLGLIITVTIALAVTHLTTPNDVSKMDPRLILPCLRPRLTMRPNVQGKNELHMRYSLNNTI